MYYIYVYNVYIYIFRKNNISRLSLLSQHPMDIPNVAGVHGALYEGPGAKPPKLQLSKGF